MTSTKYTVEHLEGCIIVTGSIPMNALSGLAQLAGQKAVLSTTLARMRGGNFAFGLKPDIDALIEQLTPGAIHKAQMEIQGLGLPEGAAEWLGAGERGTSSDAMFQTLTGHSICSDESMPEPRDPDDFRRCRLLLERVPALVPLLPNMGNVSALWGRLVASWQPLCVVMDAETPNWRDPSDTANANSTSRLMARIAKE